MAAHRSSGATLIELRRRVTTGQREAPPLGSEVPTSVLAILDRGLARESDARWPTMDVLLEALASDREFIGDPELDLTVARRPRLLLGLGFSAVAVINAGVMIWLDLRREQPPTTAEALSAGAMGVAITCGLLVLARRRVLKNAINRRLVFFGLVLTIAPFLNRCLGHLFAAPLTHVLTTDMLLAVALCAVGGAVMVRWLWYVGLAFAAGIVATVALPAAVQSILAISQCAAWVLAVGFFLAVSPVAVPPATPRRADPTSRSSASLGDCEVSVPPSCPRDVLRETSSSKHGPGSPPRSISRERLRLESRGGRRRTRTTSPRASPAVTGVTRLRRAAPRTRAAAAGSAGARGDR